MKFITTDIYQDDSKHKADCPNTIQKEKILIHRSSTVSTDSSMLLDTASLATVPATSGLNAPRQ